MHMLGLAHFALHRRKQSFEAGARERRLRRREGLRRVEGEARRGERERVEEVAEAAVRGGLAGDEAEGARLAVVVRGLGRRPDRVDALVWALTELMLDNPWGGYDSGEKPVWNGDSPWAGYQQ